MRAGHGINQLPCDANFPRCLAHRPLKDIAHAKPTSDLLYIDGLPFERKARIASNHEQPFEPRKRGGDFFNHPIRKILLLWITGHVLKREDRNGRLIWDWRGRTHLLRQRAMRFRAYSVSADRLADVLELLFAPVLEASVQLAFDFAVH